MQHQEDLRLNLGAVIKYLSRAITQFLDEEFMREQGIRSTQYTILQEIKNNKAPSIINLAERLGMEGTSLSRSLRLLQKKGFVLQKIDYSDYRNKIYILTPMGSKAAVTGHALWVNAHQGFEALASKSGIDLKKAEDGLNELIKLANKIEASKIDK